MKNIIITLLGCIMLWGCTADVVNLNNPAQFDESSYFKTQQECEQVVAAIYSTLTMKPFWARDWYFIHDLLSGQGMSTAQLAGDGELLNMEQYIYTANNQWPAFTWKGFYRMSLRGLVAIDKLTTWETKNEAEAAYKEQMLGEAYFFHGFAYFFLTELWGDVPYHPSWQSIKENPIKTRTPYAEVQTHIEEALKTAIEKLPESWPDNYLGRVTKDAARAMLGKLYLTQGKNDDAIRMFESLKAHTYSPTYEELFVTGNHTNPEVILQVLHKFWGWDQGNAYHMFDGHETWGGKATNCGRLMEYGWRDWNNMRISNTAAGLFRYTINGNAYLDPRNQFIIYGDGVMGDDSCWIADKDEDGPDKWYIGRFPYKPFIDYDPDNPASFENSSNSGYKWKKWCLYETVARMDVALGEYSSILIRLADVKLMLAEAYIGKGDYTKAKALINEVRTRPAVKADPYNDVNSSNAFDILKRERYIELFGELHYYFDLVRWDRLGKLDMLDELQKIKDLKGKTINPKYKKWPIPTQEKDTNPLILVLDGWN